MLPIEAILSTSPHLFALLSGPKLLFIIVSAPPTAGMPSKSDILPKMIARQTGEGGTSLHILRYNWTHIYKATRAAVHVHERCKVNVFGVVRKKR